MEVVVGSDHAGYALKEALKNHLIASGHTVVDVGADSTASVDYPDFGARAAAAVQAGEFERGVLVCGSGVGMSVAANRFSGVRAVLAHNIWAARMARAHNDANVLCLGERITGLGLALDIVDTFFTTPFEGGRHQGRVDKLSRLGPDQGHDR
ncbi:MAG: ribose 5-phosphate isomerase B [Proteobacteria bacterium]|nr:ribose 5-phosphate isomerase B [Pseudomonadota bacterium]